MTAPNLPLSAEDLDIIEFNTDQDADDLTYLVDPRYFERIMTQSRTALDLAAQVAQARAAGIEEAIGVLRRMDDSYYLGYAIEQIEALLAIPETSDAE